MSKNLSVSLRVNLQGTATKELTQQLKALRGEMLSVANVATKVNSEILKLAAGFKLAIAEGKGLTSALAQVSGQATLLGGRSRTLAGDVNLVGRSLQDGARDAEKMRREMERLRSVNPPRPLPPHGGGSGGGGNPSPSPANPHHGINTAMNVGMVAAATGVAAFLVSKNNVDDSIAYNSQLMNMANTAYYDRDLQGRIAGKHELSNATLSAIRQGGGSRDQASLALNTLIASGIYTPEQAKNLMPVLQMAVTGTRASSTDLAAIGTKGGLFGFENNQKDFMTMIDMANMSGKLGGFELSDMAKWLPKQMAAASLSGMKGKSDFAWLLSLNQAAMKTSGSTDEAGNNAQNILFKLNSSDTANDLKKLGIDLRGRLANGALEGKNPLFVFSDVIKGLLGKDKRYLKVQKAISESQDDAEKKALIEKAANVLEGGVVSTIFQDREALKAMIAFLNTQEEASRQHDLTMNADGTTAKDTQANMQESDFKIQAFKNEWQAAADRVFTPVGNLLGDVASNAASVLKANDGVGNALVVTTSSLLVMAAAATAASMVFGKSAVISTLTGGALGASLAAGVWGVAKMAVPALMSAGVMGITAVVGTALATFLAAYTAGGGIYALMNKGEDTWLDYLGGAGAWVMGHGFGNDTALNAMRDREIYDQNQEAEKKQKDKVETSETLSQLGALPQFQVHNTIILDSEHIASKVETHVMRKAQRQ